MKTVKTVEERLAERLEKQVGVLRNRRGKLVEAVVSTRCPRREQIFDRIKTVSYAVNELNERLAAIPLPPVN